jgi:putative PEP-CTERM system histidine kinase
MSAPSFPALVAAVFSSVLAVAALVRNWRSIASWFFFGGMAAFTAASLATAQPPDIVRGQNLVLAAKSLLPAFWLGFSLSYSRGNAREFLRRGRYALLAALIFPVGLVAVSQGTMLYPAPGARIDSETWLRSTWPAKALDVLLLVAFVAILMNLEKTLRSAVGAMRWRIKFLVLGLVVVFGAQIYTQSQALLFSGHGQALESVNVGALLIGGALIAISLARSGFAEIDIYPSHAVLEGSATLLLAGGYLFVVGVLAQALAYLGGVEDFQTQAFFVLLGVAVFAVLLFSERLRQRVRNFVGRHFQKSRHDSRRLWTLLTQRLSNMLNRPQYCGAAAKLISESFNVLAVTIWIFDEREDRLIFGASTAQGERQMDAAATAAGDRFAGLRRLTRPFNLENLPGDSADFLRHASPKQFREGGDRLGVPLITGDRWLGVAVLADRVNGVHYTIEELDLLKCIGDQVAAGLLKLHLSDELLVAKELEAFQTMSAFFVHDLKNAASSLGLMLKNLPIHFDDPAFREDALRGVGNTVDRINHLIGRLSALRNKLELKPAEVDLAALVGEALPEIEALGRVELVRSLHPVPPILGDREQLRTVITNLLLNASEAIGEKGTITVETAEVQGRAMLSVADNGCGMSAQFIRDSLFRPFHSTKKRGIGIGMFQSKIIVEAHRGQFLVQSEPGKGTTFVVRLPLHGQI